MSECTEALECEFQRAVNDRDGACGDRDRSRVAHDRAQGDRDATLGGKSQSDEDGHVL